MIKLYGKPIRVNKASQDKKSLDVGANLFIGNLDPDVDEKLLYDTFSAFGVIVTNPKIMRDPDTGNSRGFGFVSYDSFEASDAAIEAMNGQYLCNRQITVSYAYKKDTKGERHGTPAERVLAASNPTSKSRPHTMFATGPPVLPNGHQQPSPGMVLPPPPPHQRPFANGGQPIPPPMQMLRPPPPPQIMAFPPMHQQQWQQNQPPPPPPMQQQQGLPPPPMMMQQFRPPPNMPPPPPQQLQHRPPPQQQQQQPPPGWRGPPPPALMHQPHHNYPPPPPQQH